MSKEVLFVPGVGCEVREITIFKKLAALSAGEGNHVSYVDGLQMGEEGPRVTTPSEQLEAIAERLQDRKDDEPLTIVAHSLGAVATVVALQEHTPTADPNTDAVFISPPLPRPFGVLLHPSMRDRMHARGGRVSIRNGYHPDGVELEAAYFDEVLQADASFIHDLSDLRAQGRAQIVCPSADWNERCMPTAVAGGEADVLYVQGTHSLSDVSEVDLQRIHAETMADSRLLV